MEESILAERCRHYHIITMGEFRIITGYPFDTCSKQFIPQYSYVTWDYLMESDEIGLLLQRRDSRDPTNQSLYEWRILRNEIKNSNSTCVTFIDLETMSGESMDMDFVHIVREMMHEWPCDKTWHQQSSLQVSRWPLSTWYKKKEEAFQDMLSFVQMNMPEYLD